MRIFIALMVLASMTCGGSLIAAEAPTAKPTTPAPNDDQPKQADSEDKAATKAGEKPAAKADAVKAQADTSEEAPAAKSSAEQKASPQRFIPSEQLRADFDVSFPIDI